MGRLDGGRRRFGGRPDGPDRDHQPRRSHNSTPLPPAFPPAVDPIVLEVRDPFPPAPPPGSRRSSKRPRSTLYSWVQTGPKSATKQVTDKLNANQNTGDGSGLKPGPGCNKGVARVDRRMRKKRARPSVRVMSWSLTGREPGTTFRIRYALRYRRSDTPPRMRMRWATSRYFRSHPQSGCSRTPAKGGAGPE